MSVVHPYMCLNNCNPWLLLFDPSGRPPFNICDGVLVTSTIYFIQSLDVVEAGRERSVVWMIHARTDDTCDFQGSISIPSLPSLVNNVQNFFPLNNF